MASATRQGASDPVRPRSVASAHRAPTPASGQLMEAFARMAHAISVATGSIYAFTGAMAVIAIWAVLGPVFHYSDTWQLTVNTGTTIVTFLMVFVIQHAQNHDTRSIQLKLDELISAIASASNEMIEVENLSEAQIEVLYQRYQQAARAKASEGGA